MNRFWTLSVILFGCILQHYKLESFFFVLFHGFVVILAKVDLIKGFFWFMLELTLFLEKKVAERKMLSQKKVTVKVVFLWNFGNFCKSTSSGCFCMYKKLYLICAGLQLKIINWHVKAKCAELPNHVFLLTMMMQSTFLVGNFYINKGDNSNFQTASDFHFRVGNIWCLGNYFHPSDRLAGLWFRSFGPIFLIYSLLLPSWKN